ncbi:hypothetical protein DNX69_06495 [Rhodopseudomonas palustris]|uniref:Uncharacterized protein n=1 Tax=Rhodopseudomonas palustris TaxID=1076 RepID=A0A323UK14_RHOPL|nr:hypothetical protein [Rhodopseudomonas palustris]PZA12834.1 hypothetical protein DNX69_06495 [Rhodopseudomonas palustris]
MRYVFLAAAISAWSTGALGNAFDDCVLEKMPGTTSDLAAKSIKTACLRKSSVQIPEGDLKAITGTVSYVTFGTNPRPGFLAEVRNDANFIVTEITFAVAIETRASQFFTVDTFIYAPPRVMFAGLPPDPTLEMRIDPHSEKRFHFAGTVPDLTTKAKWSWYVASAKGIPNR